MKKIIFTTILLTATFLLTGCGAGTQTKQTKQELTPSIKTEQTNQNLRNYVEDSVEYKVIDSGKYPAEYSEFDDEEATSLVYHSDVKEEKEAFYKKYKALTGKKFKKDFDGTMIVVKAGFKNDSSYSLEVTNVENAGRFNNIQVKVNKSRGLTSDAVSAPYVIIFIENCHKCVKVEVK